MYKLTLTDSITRIKDGASIPNDKANTDYAAYLEWLEEGNKPLPADKPIPPTYQELRAAAYPSIEDQLDDIFHNGLVKWKATIKAIKEKYPKEL